MQNGLLPYDPRDWYWRDPSGRIFSSKAKSVVDESDAAFASWIASHGAPSPWPKDADGAASVAALDEVLAAYDLKSGLSV